MVLFLKGEKAEKFNLSKAIVYEDNNSVFAEPGSTANTLITARYNGPRTYIRAPQSTITSSFSIAEDFQGIYQLIELVYKDDFIVIYLLLAGNSKVDEKLTSEIVYMIAADHLPISTVDRNGFKALIQHLAPNYEVPSRTTITEVIDDKFELLSGKIRAQIRDVPAICVTADILPESKNNTTTFLLLSGYFIQECKLKSVSFGLIDLFEGHSADYICQEMLQKCKAFGVNLETVTAVVVSDNKSDALTKAIADLFGKNKQIGSLSQTLEMIGNKPVKELKIVTELMSSIREIVIHFRNDGKAKAELTNLQEEADIRGALKLILADSNKWSSTFHQLERFLFLADEIESILSQNTVKPQMLPASKIEELKDILNLFLPIEKLCKTINGDKIVTISKVIPLTHCLAEELTNTKTLTEIGTETKVLILSEIEEQFGQLENHPVYSIATLLDPRFKKIHFRDKNATTNAVERLQEMLKDYEEEAVVVEEAENEDEEEINVDDPLFRYHKQKLAAKRAKLDGLDERLSLALKNYLQEPLANYAKTDPITYWASHKYTLYKDLSKIAEKYFCVLASSLERQCVANVIDPNRMDEERVNQLLFLNSLDPKDWDVNNLS